MHSKEWDDKVIAEIFEQRSLLGVRLGMPRRDVIELLGTPTDVGAEDYDILIYDNIELSFFDGRVSRMVIRCDASTADRLKGGNVNTLQRIREMAQNLGFAVNHKSAAARGGDSDEEDETIVDKCIFVYSARGRVSSVHLVALVAG